MIQNFILSELRLGNSCFTTFSYYTTKYRTNSRNTIYPTKDKYFILVKYIILVQSTSCFFYETVHKSECQLKTCGLIQYKHGMVIIDDFDKVVQSMENVK